MIRAAYLLTGDQHAAEDLVQSALAKTYAKWPTIRHETPRGTCAR
ncbi:sigma factor [Micromonospora sp. DT229]